jgi:hypothetical protein
MRFFPPGGRSAAMVPHVEVHIRGTCHQRRDTQPGVALVTATPAHNLPYCPLPRKRRQLLPIENAAPPDLPTSAPGLSWISLKREHR